VIVHAALLRSYDGAQSFLSHARDITDRNATNGRWSIPPITTRLRACGQASHTSAVANTKENAHGKH